MNIYSGRALLYCGTRPWFKEGFSNDDDGRTPSCSTRPLSFGDSRYTDSLITHVCQSRQAAGELGEAAVGQQLMDGGGFHHSPCGDHRYGLEQSAAAGTGRGHELTLWLATNCLWIDGRRFISVIEINFTFYKYKQTKLTVKCIHRLIQKHKIVNSNSKVKGTLQPFRT